MDTPDINEFSSLLAHVKTKLGYGMSLEDVHADLVSTKGQTPEEAHFIIRALQFREGIESIHGNNQEDHGPGSGRGDQQAQH